MRKYTFLLLAFFLAFLTRVYAIGFMGSPSVVVNVNTNPNLRESSSRNIQELGNIKESTKVKKTDQRDPAEGAPDLNKGTKTSALKNVACKTYEGKVYDQGDAGYEECMRTIKTDRNNTKAIP